MSSLKNLLPSNTKITLSSPGSSSSKKHILKPDNETPWTAQTLPSSIHLTFPTAVSGASHIALTFQGGFVGISATVSIASQAEDGAEEVLSEGGKIFPEDKNRRQLFEIPFPPRSQDPSSAEATDGRLIRELKIEFDSSSDQFGRITLYQLELLG